MIAPVGMVLSLLLSGTCTGSARRLDFGRSPCAKRPECRRPRLSHVERVYLDHAATTPVDPEVAEAMARVLRETHGNPSSIYAEGRAGRATVDRARDEVPAAINAEPSEIDSTSGGTQAD